MKSYDEFMSDWRKYAPNGIVKAKTDSGEVVEAVVPPDRSFVWEESRKAAVRDFIEALEIAMHEHDISSATYIYLENLIKIARDSIGDVDPPVV